MKRRCYYAKNNRFHRYGGRGITICAEWKDNFENFYNWSLSNGYKEGLQIDRVDNDGNYCPENCRFVTLQENCRQRSNNKIDSIDVAREIRYKYANSRISYAKLAEEYNTCSSNILYIINNKYWREDNGSTRT